MGNREFTNEKSMRVEDWLSSIGVEQSVYETNKKAVIYPNEGRIHFGTYYAHGDLMVEHIARFDTKSNCPFDWYSVEWNGQKFKLRSYASKANFSLGSPGYGMTNLYCNSFGHPTFNY